MAKGKDKKDKKFPKKVFVANDGEYFIAARTLEDAYDGVSDQGEPVRIAEYELKTSYKASREINVKKIRGSK